MSRPEATGEPHLRRIAAHLQALAVSTEAAIIDHRWRYSHEKGVDCILAALTRAHEAGRREGMRDLCERLAKEFADRAAAMPGDPQ